MSTQPLKDFLKKILPSKTLFFLLHGWARLTWPLYRGDALECLLCGKTARKFRPARADLPVLRDLHVLGGMRGENAACPYCLSEDRERLVLWYLRNKTDVFRRPGPLRLLHVAPELLLKKILNKRPNIDYVGAGLDPKEDERRVDITSLPFPAASFDVILCNHVLEHVPDDRKAMAELFRVLKPKGWAILQVPIGARLEKTLEDSRMTSPEQREHAFGQKDHVRIYGTDYARRLEQAGFSVVDDNALHLCGPRACAHYALNEEEPLYVCRPRMTAS